MRTRKLMAWALCLATFSAVVVLSLYLATPNYNPQAKVHIEGQGLFASVHWPWSRPQTTIATNPTAALYITKLGTGSSAQQFEIRAGNGQVLIRQLPSH